MTTLVVSLVLVLGLAQIVMPEESELRSLFAWAKRVGLIFRKPTSRIDVGQYQYAVLQPLVPDQVSRSVAAATTPAARSSLPSPRSTPPALSRSAPSCLTTSTSATDG
ncbi:hypothetical protein [Streptomyces mirabilis]|uniref:hypothetical protein n=1 Tax=Streptomyces mirabilis TaxID=68239 RepID=UPI00331DF9C1